MRILIYGINFSPELTGIGKYTGELVDWLATQDHECRVITAPPYYPAWKVGKGFSSFRFSKEKNHDSIVYRCPLWVPKKPKTISRLLHLLSFMVSSFPVLVSQLNWKPDVIICIAPSFFCAPQAMLFGKIVKAKSWLHFQDFEICAMFNTDMMSSMKALNDFAHSVQGKITRQFDKVSTISHTMCNSAQKRRVTKNGVYFFPNWVDLNFITPQANKITFQKKWKIEVDTKVVLYSGNIGKKQGLELIVEAGKLLKNKQKILFVIVGDGAHRSTLQNLVARKGLQNIQFYPLQPYALLPDLLKLADIHLIIQKKGTGDAFLPSKLTSILSVGGHVIITAEKGIELYQIVEENPGIGTIIPPEDSEILASTILRLLKSNRSSYNTIARKYAETNLSKEAVLSKFENELSKLI
jgi:colanic acid biosynthesis glycosyl transferase WcaI